jgi:hypothetical protein
VVNAGSLDLEFVGKGCSTSNELGRFLGSALANHAAPTMPAALLKAYFQSQLLQWLDNASVSSSTINQRLFYT